MNKVFFILILFLGGIVVSCTTIKSISIDQMQPADFSFPSGLRTVAVVNNLPVPATRWPENFTQADMGGFIDGDGKLASEALAGHIAEGNYFDQVLICDSALRINDKERRTSLLSQEEIKKLVQDLAVDMIISLDAVFIQATPDIIYLLDNAQPTGVINAKVGTITRVYIPTRKEPLTTLVDRDSIYWVTSYINEKEIIGKSSDFAATLPVNHVIPVWKSIDRYFFSGNSVDMRDADISVKENEWEDALAIWKRVNNTSKSRKMKMHAAFNIALYYELHDQLEEAEKWLHKALELVPGNEREKDSLSADYRLMKQYLADLETRKVEMQKLNLQMSRFKDDF